MLYTFLERRLYYIPTNTCLPHLNAEIYFVQIRRVWNIFCLDQEDSKYILNISYSNQVDLKYIWNISCSDQEGARDTVSRRPQYDQHPPWALLVSFHLYQYPFVYFDDIYMICIPLSHGILTGFHLAEGYPYTQFLEYPLLVLQVTSPISTQINVNLLAPTGALVVAPLQLFHITSSRSTKSLYNLLTLLKDLEHLCLYSRGVHEKVKKIKKKFLTDIKVIFLKSTLHILVAFAFLN